MRNMKKKRNGFTLVELVIVIAVIGVLAAVLIPTFAGIIEKANLSSDTSAVKNMNTLLTTEAIFDDVESYDVDAVSNKLESLGFDLKAKAEGYTYWYDTNTNQVSVQKTDEFISTSASKIANGTIVYADDEVKSAGVLEALSKENPGHVYISKNKNGITEALDIIRNFSDHLTSTGTTTDGTGTDTTDKCATIDEVITKALDELGDVAAKTAIQSFTDNCLFVSDSGYEITNANANANTINVLFQKDTSAIQPIAISTESDTDTSKITAEILKKITNVVVPSSITVVFEGAFTASISDGATITATASTAFEPGSVTASASVTVSKAEYQLIEDFDINNFNLEEYACYKTVEKTDDDKTDDDKTTTTEKTTTTTTEKTTVTTAPTTDADYTKYYVVPKVNFVVNEVIPNFNILDVRQCVIKSSVEKGYSSYEMAIVTKNTNYKVENMQYLTDVSFKNTAIYQYSADNATDTKTMLFDIELDVDSKVFDSALYKDATFELEYQLIKTTVSNGEVKSEEMTGISADSFDKTFADLKEGLTIEFTNVNVVANAIYQLRITSFKITSATITGANKTVALYYQNYVS